MKLIAALTLAIVVSLFAPKAWADTLHWSGHEWVIKSSQERFGPGPNHWSNSSDSVWIDGQGRLNLKIRKIGDRWHCAEVYTLKALGYGKYVFYLDSRVDNLDNNVVAGLFVHSDDMNEIDIEFSKWGKDKKYTYHQFVLQPRIDETNIKRSDYRVRNPLSTHGFVWSPQTVTFRSYVGHNISEKKPHKYWDYAGPNNPKPTSERVHLNLWLFKGRPPINQKEAVLVINKFVFVPLEELESSNGEFIADAMPQDAN